MKKTQSEYYQLLDNDGDQCGIVLSDCDETTFQVMWSDYSNGELDHLSKKEQEQIGYPEDCSTDGFCAYLRLNGFKGIRIFTTEVSSSFERLTDES